MSGVVGQDEGEVPNLATTPMIPFVPQAPREKPMLSFGRMMIGKLDTNKWMTFMTFSTASTFKPFMHHLYLLHSHHEHSVCFFFKLFTDSPNMLISSLSLSSIYSKGCCHFIHQGGGPSSWVSFFHCLRQIVFMSTFWSELFKQTWTFLKMSLAYHS